MRRDYNGCNHFFSTGNGYSTIFTHTVMFNPIHILVGWFRSQIYASEKTKKLSEERLKVCRTCHFAVEKSFLKVIKGDAIEEKTKACKFCGCPILEKGLVKSEKCEMNLWKN